MFQTKQATYAFICQVTSARGSEVTFSFFKSSCHRLCYFQSNHSTLETSR